MAVRRNQLTAAEQPARNQEANETLVLSPRTSSRCLLSMEASMERIEATLQEVLQRLENLAPPQLMHQERQEFVQDWGQRGICGAGIHRAGRNHQEGRFEVQDRGRGV